jgi:hypothetical protein
MRVLWLRLEERVRILFAIRMFYFYVYWSFIFRRGVKWVEAVMTGLSFPCEESRRSEVLAF